MCKKRRSWRKCFAFLLVMGLLLTAFTSCGSEKIETADSLPEVETPSEVEPSSSEPEAQEITDAKSLAELLQSYFAGDQTLSLRVEGDMTATVTTDTGTYPFTGDIYYSNKVCSSEEAKEYLSLRCELSGIGSIEVSEDGCARMEDGQLVSYLLYENNEEIRVPGNYLEKLHFVSDIFERIGDGSVQADYSGSGSEHTLCFEASGDALRGLLKQYFYWSAEDIAAVPLDGVTMDVQVDATTFDSFSPSLKIQFDSTSLPQALLAFADGIQSAENGNFHMEISCSFYEDYTIDAMDAIPFDGDMPSRFYMTDALNALAAAAQDVIAANSFEKIETTDPVTLSWGGVSVTITFPQGMGDYEKFYQSSLTNVIIQGGFGGRTLFCLESGSPESRLSRISFLDENDKDDSYFNYRHSDIYTLNTSAGQVYVVDEEYETVNLYGQQVHNVQFYAVLPLENNMYLYLEANNICKSEKENYMNQDFIIALFDHCSAGA